MGQLLGVSDFVCTPGAGIARVFTGMLAVSAALYLWLRDVMGVFFAVDYWVFCICLAAGSAKWLLVRGGIPKIPRSPSFDAKSQLRLAEAC